MSSPVAGPTGTSALLKSLNPDKPKTETKQPASGAVEKGIGVSGIRDSGTASAGFVHFYEDTREGPLGTMFNGNGNLAMDYQIIQTLTGHDENNQTRVFHFNV